MWSTPNLVAAVLDLCFGVFRDIEAKIIDRESRHIWHSHIQLECLTKYFLRGKSVYMERNRWILDCEVVRSDVGRCEELS